MISPPLKSRRKVSFWKASKEQPKNEETLLPENCFRSDHVEEEIVFEGGFKQKELVDDGFALGVFDLSDLSAHGVRYPLLVEPEVLAATTSDECLSDHESAEEILSDLDSLAEILDRDIADITDQSDIWNGIKEATENPIFFDHPPRLEESSKDIPVQEETAPEVLCSSTIEPAAQKTLSSMKRRTIPVLFNRKKQKKKGEKPWRNRLVRSRRISALVEEPPVESNDKEKGLAVEGENANLVAQKTEKTRKIVTKIEFVEKQPLSAEDVGDTQSKVTEESTVDKTGRGATHYKEPSTLLPPAIAREKGSLMNKSKSFSVQVRELSKVDACALQACHKTEVPNANFKQPTSLKKARPWQKLAKKKAANQHSDTGVIWGPTFSSSEDDELSVYTNEESSERVTTRSKIGRFLVSSPSSSHQPMKMMTQKMFSMFSSMFMLFVGL
jgi:hypothetical protein